MFGSFESFMKWNNILDRMMMSHTNTNPHAGSGMGHPRPRIMPQPKETANQRYMRIRREARANVQNSYR